MYQYPWLDFDAATTIKVESNTTAQTLASIDTHYAGAVRADIFVDVAPVRYGFNYTPALTTGHRADKYDKVTLYGRGEMEKFRHIRGGSTSDAYLFITYKFPQGSR